MSKHQPTVPDGFSVGPLDFFRHLDFDIFALAFGIVSPRKI